MASFYTDADVRDAVKASTGIMIVPFPIPMIPRERHLVSTVEWNGWRAHLRLCTVNGRQSGGAVLTLSKDSVRLGKRIKSGRVCTHSVRNAFKRMAQAVLRVNRLATIRKNAADDCERYIAGIKDEQTRRIAIARLIKLGRKAQRASQGISRGWESMMYCNFTPHTCERLMDVVTLGYGYFLKGRA